MSTVHKLNFEQDTVLPGFENISRFKDRHTGVMMAKILPGEYYVTHSDEAIATVLGSCISACIRDRILGIGGMNHFMLPSKDLGTTDKSSMDQLGLATRFGNYAMEHMINDILKHGGMRKNLEAKICGGGKIIQNMGDIGLNNSAFVKDYLQSEGIEIVAEDVLGNNPRKVRYFPRTGKLQIMKLQSLHNDTLIQRENELRNKLSNEKIEGDVELF